MTKNYIVVTTNYSDGRIIAAYGPLDEHEANNLSMALPASSMRDHNVVLLSRPPVFDFADKKAGKR